MALSPYRRPSTYGYPPKFNKLEDAENWAKQLYRELLENDSRGEEITARATDKDLKQLIVRPEWYGAKGDGVTNDAVAIRAALAEIASGGTLFLSSKNYLISTLHPTYVYGNEGFFFEVKSNNHIIGANGAKLTVAANTINDTGTHTHGSGIFGMNTATDVSFHNFTVDMNGDNNLCPSGQEMSCYLVHMLYSSRIHISKIRGIDNPGANYIVSTGYDTGGYITVEDCEFVNGGTSMPGNTEQSDFSAIYIASPHSRIRNNRILHDVEPFTYSGGIEIHSWDIICENNYIEKSYPAIYVVNNEADTTSTGIIVRNNVVSDSQGGVAIVAEGATFSGLAVHGNIISMKQFSVCPDTKMGIWIYREEPPTTIVFPTKVENSSFLNNIIINADAQDGATYMSRGISIAAAKNLLVSGNIVRGVGAYAILIWGNPYFTENITIKNNQFIDFGNNSGSVHIAVAVNLSESSTTPACTHFDCKNVHIEDNYIRLTTPTDTSYAFYFDWSADSVIEDLSLANNRIWGVGNRIYPTGKSVPASVHFTGVASPSDTDTFYCPGDICWNMGPGSPLLWKNIVSGKPGTWAECSVIEGDNQTIGDNLITDCDSGTFDANLTGLSYEKCTVYRIAGGKSGDCLEMTCPNPATGAYQSASVYMPTLTVGHKYRSSVWVKSGTSGDEFVIFIARGSSETTDTYDVIDFAWTTSTWQEMSVEFTATEVTHVAWMFKETTTPGTMLFDELTCVEMGATITADDGTVTVLGDVNLTTGNAYQVAGTQVVGAQALAEADAKADYTTGDLDIEAEIIAAVNATNTKINNLLAKLRTHGLIDT